MKKTKTVLDVSVAGLVAAAVIAAALLFGAFLFGVIKQVASEDEVRYTEVRNANHYNFDFTRYCIQLGGTPQIGSQDVCYRGKTILLRESSN